MILPSVASIDDLYGQMIRGRFNRAEFGASTMTVVDKLTAATIELWRQTKAKMLPTPAKFHYIFNMRDLSRVFQGVFLTPKDTITTGGQQTPTKDGGMPPFPIRLLRLLWVCMSSWVCLYLPSIQLYVVDVACFESYGGSFVPTACRHNG